MRAALGRNVAANMLSVLGAVAAQLISLPFVLAGIGASGYGVWTIGLAFVFYLSAADAGFAPALQRWSALAKGRADRRQAAQLLWTALALYTVIGVVALALVVVLAGPIVRLFDFPAGLRGDAVQMFRLIGVALLLTLLAAAAGNVLQGLERFVAMGVSSGLAAGVYLAAVVALLAAGRGVVGLAQAVILQQGLIACIRFVALRDVIAVGAPRLIARAEVRAMAGFSLRVQVAVLAWLFNSQSDKIVMGLIASSATVGQLGIASQVADAGRLVAGAALAPIISALSVLVATADRTRLLTHFAWTHRLWLEIIGGGTVIGLGVLHPLLTAWLGGGYGRATVFGLFLVAAMGFALLSGSGVAYMRASGRPDIEGRYGVVMVGLNILLTVPLAVALGPVGVVAGTLGAYGLAAWWFLHRFGIEAPETQRPRLRDAARPFALALVAGAVSLGAGMLAVEWLGQGVAIAPVLGIAGLCFAGYLSAISGRPLTPSGARSLLRGLRQPA